MPHSSMVEQAVVNREVVGSSPTEAAIHCRVDELVSRIALNDEVAGSSPALAIKPCGVIGNIAPFEGEDSRFESWWGCQTLIPLMVSEAKVVEALVCGTSHSGFKSRQTPLNGRCC